MLYSNQTLSFDGNYAIDNVGPIGSMTINFYEYATAARIVNLSFDITDEISGIESGAEMMFSNDGESWSPAEPYLPVKTGWDITSYGGSATAGTKTIYGKVSDALGNWTTFTDSIYYVPNRQVLEVPTHYSSIQAAIDAAQDGDMVYVLPGTYDAGANITLKDGVRLQGSGPAQTILSGAQSVGISTSRNSMVDGFGGYFWIYVLDISNGPVIISNNLIRRWVEIIDTTGIKTEAIVRNNLFLGSKGIRIGSNNIKNMAQVTLENNTFSNRESNQGESISIDRAIYGAKIIVKNNIISNNKYGISEGNTHDITHQHIFPSFNTYWNNTYANSPSMGPDDMNADPLFINAATGDLRLQSASSSINRGDPDMQYNNPDGTRNKRGAYGGPMVNTPPHADFNIYPFQGDLGTIFTLDASFSHDGESPDEKLEVRWDMNGDGTYDTPFSSNKFLLHQYNVPGTYSINLQVKDGGGFISTMNRSVVVNDQYPYVALNPTPAGDSQNQDINLTLRWNEGAANIVDAVTYDVYFGKTSDPPLISADQLDSFFAPGTLEYNATYYWKVVGKDKSGKQSFGNLWSFTTTSEPVPLAPINLSAETLSSSEIKLNWSNNSSEKLGFIIERKKGENGDYNSIKVVGKNITTHTDISLSPGSIYYYRVTAYNSAGNSPYSNEISVTTETYVRPGDVNGDGNVDLVDAIAALQINIRVQPASQVYKQADVNGDNKISPAEAIYALQCAAGLRNKAPALAGVGDKTVNEGASLTFTVSGTDDDGDALTYSAAPLPSGAAFNANTGAFSWTPTYAQVGTYQITFAVSDSYGGSDTETVNITVSIATPVFSAVDYFPLNVGDWYDYDLNTIGNVKRSSVTGIKTINGVDAKVLSYWSGNTEYYTADQSGVYLYGQASGSAETIFETPLLLMPENALVGMNKISTSHYTTVYSGITYHVDVTSTASIMAVEEVAAEHATLSDCLKVSVRVDQRIVELNQSIPGSTVYYWFSKGIGVVKQIAGANSYTITASSVNGVLQNY